ncbi:Collagenase-like protease, PrtC family [Tistlia consotensis]|uniref:Ubiquinone biosynthesis protein UbiV n=1 Tax=Tistlia consotensis USBA 355 TaxID=560819 RepID=A0A1Y6BNT5_9PROT|nr:U32 family peptidase [Tistlia consotensis]SMF21661.1 Collagenase-like protease, PrtC family [Tistlia consotensis USBA 355]SNR46690.1 Collagenase-like protease, PrtC family [Tistlia consotensis]
MPDGRPELTLGPVLFNWRADDWADFYARIADEADLDRVVLGEVVCSKRLPFYAQRVAAAVERLQRGGKAVALASLALVTSPRERGLAADLAAMEETEIEVNDLTLLGLLPAGRGFSVGPLVNVYNEATLAFLAERGARRVCLPPELPLASVAALATAAEGLSLTLEVWSFGRVPLALSGRCYHARIHGLSKDSCQFVCAEDPDGLAVETLDGEGFLAVNGVQTLSYSCATTLGRSDDLRGAGLTAFRLSPQLCDMVAVTRLYRDRLAGALGAGEALARLQALQGIAPLSDGFLAGGVGAARVSGPGPL